MGIGLCSSVFREAHSRFAADNAAHDELARFRFKSWTRTSERRQRYRAALAGASGELYDQPCWSRAFVGWALRSRAPPRSSAQCPRVLSTRAKIAAASLP